MIDRIVSHYRILEQLGEGGMGVVYKAEDTKLKRTVALKFLPPHLTRDNEAKQRFIHEAQAASALQHSNICTIHDIDESDAGSLFIVMDCYEGDTLKNKMVNCQLTIDNCIEIVTQVGQGLQKAHEKGIVHRDIKPANIMVTNDGVVKILDFGLAKLAGQGRLTRTGSTVGTAAYMSPEQARGLEVDHRTDIWSLGVVLFEMLTEKLPFQGDHEAAMLYSIVHEEPGQVLEHRLDIPVGLALTVSKALQKEPNERYQSMQELINDLKAASSPVVQLPKQEKSIIVLPFENLSPDPDQEYFSDGLTEEVISDLSNVRALRVISRSSAMTFKGTKKKIPEIAREVNVQYVLEGSVRKAGNSLRITAQLIDGANDAHLWAEKYSGTLDDVFDIQEKVARSIVEALRVQLTPSERRKMAERPIADVRAHECYLRATATFGKLTESAMYDALRDLKRALEIVGENAVLYCEMGYVYWWLANIGVAIEENLDKCGHWARKALVADPTSTKARALLALSGYTYRARKPRPEDIRQLKQVLEDDPHEPLALLGLSFLYMFAGRHSEAVRLSHLYAERQPLDGWTHTLPWFLLWCDGQYEGALEEARKTIVMGPDEPVLILRVAWSLAWTGRSGEANAHIDRVAGMDPNVYTKLILMLKHGLRGDLASARAELTPEFHKWCNREAIWSYFAAVAFALAGGKDDTLEWLEHAVELGWINYPLLAEKDPLLVNIRTEDRFKKLMERVKKEWEEFEV